MYDQTEKFYNTFCKKTQSKNGMWEQRFFTDGRLAPCWGYQIDETASVVYGVYEHYKIKKEDATKILEYEIIAKWRELDGIVNDISMNLEVKTPRSIIQFLVDNRFIDDEEKDVLRRFLKVRNNIVHSMDNNYTEPELKVMLDDIDKIINKIKKIM